MSNQAGKGDTYRPVDKAKYDRNYERMARANAKAQAAKLVLYVRHLTDEDRRDVFNILRRQYCLNCGAKRPEETCGCFDKEM
jgi:hypothetical protein